MINEEALKETLEQIGKVFEDLGLWCQLQQQQNELMKIQIENLTRRVENLEKAVK